MTQAQKYAAHCNEHYSRTLQETDIASNNPGPSSTTKTAIITCMDGRLDVFKMFNLQLGEAHIIRVGGGRAPDALRSVIASEHILGSTEVMVVHHTDCGFEKLGSEDKVREKVREALGGLSVDHVSFMPIMHGQEQSVRDDVEYLRHSPYVKRDAVISGYIYNVLTGKIDKVDV